MSSSAGDGSAAEGHTVLTPDWDSGAVTAVVSLAAGLRGPSPLDGTVHLERVLDGRSQRPPLIQLVHGRQDPVVSPDVSAEFAAACRTAGIPCRLSLVDSDHASVVGTRYQPHLRLCVPDDG
jgi:hypothetical protein